MKKEKMKSVYVSGALTGLPDLEEVKLFYEQVGQVYEKNGIRAYVPHKKTDPVRNPSVTPKDVFRIDLEQLNNADCVFAYVGRPSTGVGLEIGFALGTKKKTIIAYEKDKNISRIIRGIDKAEYIEFENVPDCLSQLDARLKNAIKK